MGNLRFLFLCLWIVAVILISSPYTKADDDEGEDIDSGCSDTTKCKQGLLCTTVGDSRARKICKCPAAQYRKEQEKRCVDKIDDGADCGGDCTDGTPCVSCKDKCKSGVARNNRCECADKTKYYDAATKTCKTRVAKGEDCTDEKECGENQKCDQATKKCVCGASAFDGTSNDCKEKVGNNAEATDVKQCKPTLILKDVSGKRVCGCSDTQAFVPVLDKCVTSLDPGASCKPRFTPCKYGGCRKGKCPCEDGKYFDGTACQENKKVGEDCKKDYECVSGSECLEDKCECTEGHFEVAGKCMEVPFMDICGATHKSINLKCAMTLKAVCGTMKVTRGVTNVKISASFGDGFDDKNPPTDLFATALPEVGSMTKGLLDFDASLNIKNELQFGTGILTIGFQWNENGATYKAEKSLAASFSCGDRAAKDMQLLVTNVKTDKTTINPHDSVPDILTALKDSADVKIELKTSQNFPKTTMWSPRHICLYIRPGNKPETPCDENDPKTYPPNRNLQDRTLAYGVYTGEIGQSYEFLVSSLMEAQMGPLQCTGDAQLIIQFDCESIDDDKNKCNNFFSTPVTLDCGAAGAGDPQQDVLGLSSEAGLQAFAINGEDVYSYDLASNSYYKNDLPHDWMTNRGIAVYRSFNGYIGEVLNNPNFKFKPSKMCKVAIKRMSSFFDHDLQLKNKDIEAAVKDIGKHGYTGRDLKDLENKIETPEDVGAFRALKLMFAPRTQASVDGDNTELLANRFLGTFRPMLAVIKLYAEYTKTVPSMKDKMKEWISMQKTFLIALMESGASDKMNLNPVAAVMEEIEKALDPTSTSDLLSLKCRTKIDLVMAMVNLTLKHDLVEPIPEDKKAFCKWAAASHFLGTMHEWGKDVNKIDGANDDGCGQPTGMKQLPNSFPIFYEEKDDKVFAKTLDLLNERLVGRQIAVMNCPDTAPKT